MQHFDFRLLIIAVGSAMTKLFFQLISQFLESVGQQKIAQIIREQWGLLPIIVSFSSHENRMQFL